jgi:glycosyltransferase involved in cell wall biosynthesis
MMHRLDLSDLPLDFSAKNYLDLNPDLIEGNVNPYQHYLIWGKAEARPYRPEHLPSPNAELAPLQTLPSDFDAAEYLRLNSDLELLDGSPEEHFLTFGVFEFRKYLEDRPPAIPNDPKYKNLPMDFDPEIYLTLNQDLLCARINPYDHYATCGFHEGRPVHFPQLFASVGKKLDPGKPTVLVVSHEASRTGAPVLAWNLCRQLNDTHNTVVLLLGDGGLLPNFQFEVHATYVVPSARHNHAVAKLVARELQKRHQFEFSILNSMETGILCKPLTLAGIPTVLLIHEFAAYTTPRERFLDAHVWASVSVFSNDLIKSNAIHCFPNRLFEYAHVLPQGKCALPPTLSDAAGHHPAFGVNTIVANKYSKASRKLVIGIGTICMRKGVDLFIEVATRMKSIAGRDAFDFLWIGAYPPYSHEYSAFLNDQIDRGGMSDNIRIASETDDLDSLYEEASLLLLSSRLDPLPNVAIDAICKGLPIVCFDKASGIAGILHDNGLGEQCVAEYINTLDMATKALRIMDENIHQSTMEAFKKIGLENFSMRSYFEKLFALKQEASDHLNQVSATAKALLASGRFDFTYYTGSEPLQQEHSVKYELCLEYVLQTRVGALLRKPVVGFNPFIYRERMGLPPAIDPLLHYVEHSDDPDYQSPSLITPASHLQSDGHLNLRVALHIHAYYPSLLGDILERLPPNRSPLDLFITVDSDEKEREVMHILREHTFEQAQITQYPNQGRDVYPFLSLCETLVDHYDVIGHVHTKKSPHALHVFDLVPRWRKLLLGNLIGSKHEERMLDRIVSHMAVHPEVQIVFPDDPFVVGWGKNTESAKQLIPENELAELPQQFEFPIGTMFWARADYLKELAAMKLPQRFILEEPLPADGTVLHAWERLLGAKIGTNPLHYALTFVPGLNR